MTFPGWLSRNAILTPVAVIRMAQSIPGDSGGPVWQLGADSTTATVVCTWLGEHLDGNATRYGRFISLTDILVGVAELQR